MAIVRADLLALAIVLGVVAAIFFYFIGYPLLWIGVAALIGCVCVFGYWIYKQTTRGGSSS